MKELMIFVLMLTLMGSCKVDDSAFVNDLRDSNHLHKAMDKYTDVIVHDIFSPPQASRNYVYPSIAAYEVMQQGSEVFRSFTGQLRDMPEIPAYGNELYLELAALEAFLQTGTFFIFSEDKLKGFREELYEELKSNAFDKQKWERSLEYGQLVSSMILSWADKDNYKESRSFPKYSIDEDPATWKPTPPAYMEGIEPSWNKIRPMVLASADQFKPLEPTKFDLKEGSAFYNELMEVYDAVKNANQEETEIASFWDCNPYVMNLTGHVMYATKKITPGGHWMGIASIASRKAGDDLLHAARTYALTGIGLFDGFISCWDEKYRSKLVRPETLINEHIDSEWKPILQTPPFPEYTSGHSVISTAAAVVLTGIYGNDFDFEDSVELKYGLPIRKFDSFLEASQEAAISRLYGGIHYMPAITQGQLQGKEIGELINKSIELEEG